MFFRQSLVLNLKKEIVFAKELPVFACSTFRLPVLAFHQVFTHFTRKAAGKADQSFRVLGEKALANARLVIKAMHGGFGSDLDEILVAFITLSKHQQVVVFVA